jgi:hypothetical protein
MRNHLTILGITAWLAVVACGSARNTPEEAFESLRTAIAEERWDLLYDVLPPEHQEFFDGQVAENDARLRALVEQKGDLAATEILSRELGVTYPRWQKMTVKERFAAVFAPSAKSFFVELGINQEHVAGSSVKSVTIGGSEATVFLDDGKGHRPRLRFVLVADYWRYDPGQ